MEINRIVKIIAGIMVFLGVLSLIFLLTAKKKTPTTAQPGQTAAAQAANDKQIKKAFVVTQWQQCKDKKMPADTTLFWNVGIQEGIPEGGTYAKGALDNANVYPVHIVIKSDGKLGDKIKPLLIPGKNAALRGTCTDVATDGSVILQVF